MTLTYLDHENNQATKIKRKKKIHITKGSPCGKSIGKDVIREIGNLKYKKKLNTLL